MLESKKRTKKIYSKCLMCPHHLFALSLFYAWSLPCLCVFCPLQFSHGQSPVGLLASFLIFNFCFALVCSLPLSRYPLCCSFYGLSFLRDETSHRANDSAPLSPTVVHRRDGCFFHFDGRLGARGDGFVRSRACAIRTNRLFKPSF
jgi:hypothetical protein